MIETTASCAIARADWSAYLGDDLMVLLCQSDVPVASVEVLARLDAPAHISAAFCLQLADGSLLKARRALSAARAAQISYFLHYLKGDVFPAVHAVHKAGLLLEWVTGAALGSPAGEQHVRASGRLQGQLHLEPTPHDCPYAVELDLQGMSARMEQSLSNLCECGALLAQEARAITQLARRSRPGEASTGIIHTDLCPDNLVASPDGVLRPVDNESLQIGYLDLDLARTWYRWPLAAESGAAFLAEYDHFRSSSEFRGHFPFWFTFVLLESARYRIGSASRAWELPVARLRAFMRNPRADMLDV